MRLLSEYVGEAIFDGDEGFRRKRKTGDAFNWKLGPLGRPDQKQQKAATLSGSGLAFIGE